MKLISSSVFALSKRENQKKIIKESQRLLRHCDLRIAIDAMPLIVFVLNSCRQIVHVNSEVKTLLEIDDITQLYGVRLGEAMGCIHSSETPGGCGTSSTCQECGALSAILNGLNGFENIQECMIRTKKGSMFNLKIKSSPVQFDQNDFVIISAVDIQDEKWREVMEKTFFHDAMNLIGAIQGISDVICEFLPEGLKEIQELTDLLSQNTRDLMDEFHNQKDIFSAENQEMSAEFTLIHSKEIIDRIVETYRHHGLAKDKRIIVDSDSEDKLFLSNKRLLMRILGNMIKNALEASESNDYITIGCKQVDDTIRFHVHNSKYMPISIQGQIFKRSFSTKGQGCKRQSKSVARAGAE